MTSYIITEEQIASIEEHGWIDAFHTLDQVRSHPYNPQAEREPSYEKLVDFARWTQTFWKHGITIMRKNGLKIESDTPMEKLAFTFYSNLCEIDQEVSHLFEEGYGDKNYKDESDISCQTIKMYPKPYDERIRQAERERVLDKLYVKMELRYNFIDHSELDEIFEELRKDGE